MDLALAQQVLAAAVAHAESIGVRLSFTVVDDRGHEVLTARMDGAPWFTPHIARTKAQSCISLGVDSAALAGLDATYPGLLRLIEEQSGHTVTTLDGGILVKDPGGTVLGAVAGSGAQPDQDAAAARAGAAHWLAAPPIR